MIVVTLSKFVLDQRARNTFSRQRGNNDTTLGFKTKLAYNNNSKLAPLLLYHDTSPTCRSLPCMIQCDPYRTPHLFIYRSIYLHCVLFDPTLFSPRYLLCVNSLKKKP